MCVLVFVAPRFREPLLAKKNEKRGAAFFFFVKERRDTSTQEKKKGKKLKNKKEPGTLSFSRFFAFVLRAKEEHVDLTQTN